MKKLIRLAAFFALLVPVSSFAHRREYRVTWKGERKAGAEVCFYRGARPDVFALFFSSGDVRCLPADKVLDFPPGILHAFARHKDGYASVYRDVTVGEGPARPERGYEMLEIPLVQAGTVDFTDALKSLSSNQRLGLWVSANPTSSGIFIPLVPGENTVLVPIETTVVPLCVQDGAPVAIGDPLYLEAGEREVAAFRTHSKTSDVIVGTTLDKDSVRESRNAEPPAITLRVAGRTIRPITPLYVTAADLLMFRDVPVGKATLTLEGALWSPVTRTITVDERPTTVEREVIPLRIGGTVVVRWSTASPSDVAPACESAKSETQPPAVRAALRHCNPDQQCPVVATASGEYLPNGSLTFQGVPPGDYTAMIEPPSGSARSASRQSLAAHVTLAKQTTLDVRFASFSFFGVVKLNGKPLHARLTFETGQAVSDEQGQYTAMLAGDPRTGQIRIRPCDGSRSFRFVPREAMAENAVYDINVQFDSLSVRVVDPRQEPVSNASVTFSPIREIRPNGNVTYFTSSGQTTDEKGHVAFDDVPHELPVMVCAKHPDYLEKCSAPIDVAQIADKPAVVQFDPVGMHGHVEGHSGYGFVAFVNPAGATTERIDLRDDGKFLCRIPHAAPEHVIYVSQQRPLTVLPLPPSAPTDLSVMVPAAPVRTFVVTAPNLHGDGYLGIWIGDLFVPLDVFNTHMEYRGLDSVLHGGQSLRVPDIAATGPISVAVAVEPEDAKHWVDPFTLPQYAGVARQRVEGSAVVISH